MKRLHRFAITATIIILIFCTSTAQNVGIGILNPNHKLTIQSSNTSTLRLIGPGANGSQTRLTFGDSDFCFIEEDEDDRLKIYSSGRTAIMGGNVGIGTLSPQERLDVVGGAIRCESPGFGFLHTNNTTTSMGTYVDESGGWLGTITGNPLYFYTNNSAPHLAISTDGNVGIGTTNPGSGYRLDVVGAISCVSPGTGFVHRDGTTVMSTYVDVSAGWLGTRTEHPLWFFTGDGDPRMTINYGNGYVGIGTTDPQQPLHVIGNFRSDGEVRSTGAGYGLLHSYTGVTAGTYINASAAMLGTYSNHPLWFFTNNDIIPKMAIDNTTGFVGIGTSSPTDKLHVIGHVKATGWFESLNSSTGLRQINAGITLSTFIGGGAAWFGAESNHPLWFFTNNSPTPLMVIQNTTGLVGIRKTVPDADLHIKQSASSTTRGIILEYADNANDWRAQIDNDNDFSLWYNGVLKTWFWDTDGSFHMASDRRLKKDIVMMESTLSKVMALEPATYHYLDAANADTPRSSGFMAQDVQQLFPDLVSEKNGFLGLNYVGFIPVAIKAIQELADQVDGQQEIIDAQEERIAKLEAAQEEMMRLVQQVQKAQEKAIGTAGATGAMVTTK